MITLKDRFLERATPIREEFLELKKKHSDVVLGEYTIGQVVNGMRGMIGLFYETSSLDPDEGIRFRGYSIPELREKLPKVKGGTEPMPEGVFYLMLMDEIPTQDDAHKVTVEWQRRSNVPKHVFNMLDSLPRHTHPRFLQKLIMMELPRGSFGSTCMRM
jgi:citrate synthase